MANWHTIDELHDISADLPRFTGRSQNLPPVSGWISRRLRPITSLCAATRTPPPNAGGVALSSAENCCRRISLTVARSACSNFTRRLRWRTGNSPLWNCPAVREALSARRLGAYRNCSAREPETLNARALALLSDEGLSQPGIFVKTSSPKGERERLPNPTLAVTDGNVTVKFHPRLSSRSSPAKRKHCERRSRHQSGNVPRWYVE